MSKIIIIDYNLGNLFSVQHACTSLGLDAQISQNIDDIINAEAIILPGVGAFNEAMNNLERLNLIAPILEHVNAEKPFFGICLGLQLLFTESEEFGTRKGLNLIPGEVLKFPKEVNNKKLIVPQIGWNTISPLENKDFDNTPLENIKVGEFTYFVHSYYVSPDNQKDTLSVTNYEGHIYCSSIIKKNIFATQFHPEKSGVEGLKIYKNWAVQNNLI
tara:strand:- start:557 stop:1204 length:648 start_codon:yes stop_codon:yes gene_type:complete